MTREQIKSYTGQIVKVQETFGNNTATFIASVKSVTEWGMVSFGHPYDVERSETGSGELTINCCCVDSISDISLEDKLKWLNAYIEFHKMILEEEDYDWCEEKIIIGIDPRS